ncbi:MAG: leucine-rich repeat domain-containing protein, partial [Clostridia bacterium]|nr:leucine-rich repeat domain-containing protein [Clostridia bacterium]
MDDDVVRNTGNANFLGKPMDNFKTLFNGLKNLEYCYLRLDTRAINTNSFSGCTKLKYINLENLTQLKTMAQNNHFSGCTSLFDGQVLDLTRTQLSYFENSGTFTDVPLKGVKFPETMTKIGSESTFKNCTKLETITIGSKVTTIGSNAFEGCTSLKAIYYVGTAEQLSASPVSNVITATTKSYAEYKALSDKSGVY